MERRVIYHNKILPYLFVAPQILCTIVFFLWPAIQGVYSSFMIEDAFGFSKEFAGLLNFTRLFTDPEYYYTLIRSLALSVIITFFSMTIALILAGSADSIVRGSRIIRTLLIWPYAVAPAIAGVIWYFLFDPSLGILTEFLKLFGIEWNYTLNGIHAFVMIAIASIWRQIAYNFIFFLAGLQAIPKTLIEASVIDNAKGIKQFLTIQLPLLSPVIFFLVTINMVYGFFDTFGIIEATTNGGPGTSTTILMVKVYNDGIKAFDYTSSAAQSMVLIFISLLLTFVQFRYVEKKVHYS